MPPSPPESRALRGWVPRLGLWLERRACRPEFAGGMLGALAFFFFLAATNTLSGWLYVISGVSFALLLLGGWMPARLLEQIEVTRSPILPVSAGDDLSVEVVLTFRGYRDRGSKVLLEIADILPEGMATVGQVHAAFELDAGRTRHWLYGVRTQQRGIFWLRQIELATASPFGLLRSRRSRVTATKAIVYPIVLPLAQCPLVDWVGRENSPRLSQADFAYNLANEGLTRTLRPYRWGDPSRLVHWRTSARFGELRVRELEITLGGNAVAIALDTRAGWDDRTFEEAVVAAASLYFYALRQTLNVRLWLPETGLLSGNRTVLEALAGVTIATGGGFDPADLPEMPLAWLTWDRGVLERLPAGSRWVLWGATPRVSSPGIAIDTSAPTEGTNAGEAEQAAFQSLQRQLQAPLQRAGLQS